MNLIKTVVFLKLCKESYLFSHDMSFHINTWTVLKAESWPEQLASTFQSFLKLLDSARGC